MRPGMNDKTEWRQALPPEGKRILICLRHRGFCVYGFRRGSYVYSYLYKNARWPLRAIRRWRWPEEPL